MSKNNESKLNKIFKASKKKKKERLVRLNGL